MAEDFIEDDFNLTGLNTLVPFWKEGMEMVLDVEAGEYNVVYLTHGHCLTTAAQPTLR